MLHVLRKETREPQAPVPPPGDAAAVGAVAGEAELWSPPPFGATVAAGNFPGLVEPQAPPLARMHAEDCEVASSGEGDAAAGPVVDGLGKPLGSESVVDPEGCAASPAACGTRVGRPGDWFCVQCGDMQFARNAQCRLCGAKRPVFQ